MARLSKSKLLAFRQCPKRLWLELHRPELRHDDAAAEAAFQVGHQVGEIARRLYDPAGSGVLIEAGRENFPQAFARTRELLTGSQPIFEAGFATTQALAFADILLPARKRGRRTWRMVEVKSSTSVKDYHRDDVAIQAHVATGAGLDLASVAVAHVDNKFTYPGGGDYRGLLAEVDQTEEALARGSEVREWIGEAQSIAGSATEPVIRMGPHCADPFDCGFQEYCRSSLPPVEFPVDWLPRKGAKLKAHIEAHDVTDLRQVPDDLLNEQQRRVKIHTLTGSVHFDAAGAAADLKHHSLPAWFMDFETAQLAVPIWKGTRPYQQIPFQFSVHRLSRTGALTHDSFLDLSGDDPSRPLAERLIGVCGERGPIFVYNAGFERARLGELADRFPRLKRDLLAIGARLVDLLPVARERYYHPDQQGSWSIKSLLPAVVPELRYDALEGIQDGGMAMAAYLEAIAPATTAERRGTIKAQLEEYCRLDTYALVRLWQVFSGRADLRL